MKGDLQSKLFSTEAGPQWKKLEVKHHHGICLPLSALHSHNSCGIGEFLDLLPLIDWCKELGFEIIQLLPLNDSGLDFSPYNSLSAFALNPTYLSLDQLLLLNKIPGYEEKMTLLRRENQTSRVKYSLVRRLKFEMLTEYFHQQFPEVSQSEEYQNFLKNNAWLESYALFCALKEKYQWMSWEDWPLQAKSPSEDSYKNLRAECLVRVQFYQFLQFLSADQLTKVKQIAENKGIKIKGDIPILISRDSADVWANRSYFLVEYAAGAPPDMFSDIGQNWGFPVYDWEALEKRKYDWWRMRLQFAERFYHIYRIDHVVGFFRIWAIPKGRLGKEGHFIPQEEAQWLEHGKKLMEMMLHSSTMLPIGEDLGVVPPPVRACLYSLGICGTKVMRWERRWEEDQGFIPIEEYNPESMTTVSTHDSETLQLWWVRNPKDANDFATFKGWEYQPFLSLEHQAEILKDSHHSNSLFHINLLQEYLTLFPTLISKNPEEERINVPGKIMDTNWTYRFRPSVEELVTHEDLKNMMRYLIM